MGVSLISDGKMFRAGQCQVQETRTRIKFKRSTSLFHAQDSELLIVKAN